MKYCTKCGAKHPDEAMFCANCGTPFAKENQPLLLESKRDYIEVECEDYLQSNSHKAVDLGLSVLWSTCEVGATVFSGIGLKFAWGDETRKTITSKWSNAWFAPPRSSSICGSSHDMARDQWGSPWRLPTREEFAELVQNCEWDFVDYKGQSFVKFTGSNGNFIMMRSCIMLWIGDNAEGDYVSAFHLDVEKEICGDVSLYYNVDTHCYVRAVISK